MKNYKDSVGIDWSVSVTTSALKRIKAATGADFAELDNPDNYQRLLTDVVFLSEVAYAVCAPQAESLKISHEKFDDSMDGATIDRASTAILAELMDFFRPRHPEVAQTIEKMLELKAQAQPLAIKKIQEVTLESLEQSPSLAPKSGNESTNLPASVESIPPNSLSAS